MPYNSSQYCFEVTSIHINQTGKVLTWPEANKKILKACLRYFWRNFWFSPNDSPSKNMKDVFYFVEKALFVLKIFAYLYFHLPLFSPCQPLLKSLIQDKIKLYDVINRLNKNSITHFVWYLKKEKRYDIETLSIDRVLNKEHFYGKIMQKICTKS